jgi:hypothetical protein
VKARPDAHRRAAAVAALVVAAFVSLASGSDPTTIIDGEAASGTLTVVAGRTMATQVITVGVNAAASALAPEISLEVTRDGPETAVLTVLPLGAEGAGTVASDIAFGSEGGSRGAREVDLGAIESFDLICATRCERSFRLILYGPPATGPVSVTWHARSRLIYRGADSPAGAASEIRVDAPVTVNDDSSSRVGIADQAVTVDSSHPSAIRVVEIRMSADAVPPNSSDLVSVARLDTLAPGEDPYDLRYGVTVVGLDQPWVVPGPFALAQFAPTQFDPFGDFVPGIDCVRRFVITVRWLTGGPETVHWSLTVSQVRLRGERAPSGSLGVEVVGAYDVASVAPQRVHFEGDLTLVAGTEWGETSASVRLAVEPDAWSADGPWAEGPVPLWATSAPIVAWFSSEVAAGVPPGRGNNVDVSVWSDGGYLPGSSGVFNPGWLPATHDLPMTIKIVADVYPPPSESITVHWTLDVDLYQYEGLPPLTLVRIRG